MNAVRDNARQAFAVTGGFLIVVAALGALLRWQSVWPMTGVNYSHWLHAHSHTAFLGWVFNAFLALPLRRFVVPEAGHAFCRLFLLMQVAVLVMLFAYPIEGYGAVSIAFPPFTCCARWCLRGLRGDCGGGIARRRRHGCICAMALACAGLEFCRRRRRKRTGAGRRSARLDVSADDGYAARCNVGDACGHDRHRGESETPGSLSGYLTMRWPFIMPK